MIKKFSEWAQYKEEGLGSIQPPPAIPQQGIPQQGVVAMPGQKPSQPQTITHQDHIGNEAGEHQVEKPEVMAMLKFIGTKTGNTALAQEARPMLGAIAQHPGWLDLLYNIMTSGGGMTASTFAHGQNSVRDRFK